VVVNVGVKALLALFPSGRYLNGYELATIGWPRPDDWPLRIQVDTALDLDEHTYFAAVALGGAGVRYYGEYCLVLDIDGIDPDPKLFDRDSYDILIDPFTDLPDPQPLIDRLRGRWPEDVYAMVLMKVLPELDHRHRLVTAGTVSEQVLKDQEFIEVHLHPDQDRATDGQPRSFGPDDVLEVRESPDEVAVATRLREREADGVRLTDIEYEWLVRRESVSRVLGRKPVPTRVVTQHGRGYQWT
jgi:hypothetical protein